MRLGVQYNSSIVLMICPVNLLLISEDYSCGVLAHSAWMISAHTQAHAHTHTHTHISLLARDLYVYILYNISNQESWRQEPS